MPEAVWTIVVAGGSGQRFGKPKQFEELGGRRVLDWAVAAASDASDGVVLVLPAANVDRSNPLEVAGGATRSESVRNGLAAVPENATVVCVHDAARPFASSRVFAAVIGAVAGGADAAVPGVPVVDTIKVVAADGTVMSTPDRSTLVAVQTPQAFRAASLRAAHAAGAEGTDDAALVERLGGKVVVVPGEPRNRKITEPNDLAWARSEVGR
ncbi:MAG: 2-C-methyl-D-erythritol 4-phosphate cytidylyltransferase [Actinobacteria bacterium]|nr:2-C-methyl-D-erythritol 4-phosphate cytidylyltransferase [Actinomycetota bacterium]MSX78934.1 2-C-methyl-D-erythritol 4-phosphate cytidylyltransferase [Actinomycetota bacterium]